MVKRKIIIEPDPILRIKSENLNKVDNTLRKLMDDMLETMYAAPGIGLAAVQIGILKRLIADGLLATCIQHEIDHLDGVLFIDYLSKLKKDMIIKKLIKHKKKTNKIIL